MPFVPATFTLNTVPVPPLTDMLAQLVAPAPSVCNTCETVPVVVGSVISHVLVVDDTVTPTTPVTLAMSESRAALTVEVVKPVAVICPVDSDGIASVIVPAVVIGEPETVSPLLPAMFTLETVPLPPLLPVVVPPSVLKYRYHGTETMPRGSAIGTVTTGMPVVAI